VASHCICNIYVQMPRRDNGSVLGAVETEEETVCRSGGINVGVPSCLCNPCFLSGNYIQLRFVLCLCYNFCIFIFRPSILFVAFITFHIKMLIWRDFLILRLCSVENSILKKYDLKFRDLIND
jgi:hypothetical protein